MSIVTSITKSDNIGNLLAAIVAVTGYLLDAYNTRKYKQLETQIERVCNQSRNLLVPITTQFHSLFTISTLQFVDTHLSNDIILKYVKDHPQYDKCIISNLQTIVDSNSSSSSNNKIGDVIKGEVTIKRKDDVKKFCERFLRLYIQATSNSNSGYYASPDHLQNPVSLPFLYEDVLFRRIYVKTDDIVLVDDVSYRDDETERSTDNDNNNDEGLITPKNESTSYVTKMSSDAGAVTTNTARPSLIKSIGEVKKCTTSIQGNNGGKFRRRPGAITSPQELPNPLHYALLQIPHKDKVSKNSYLWKSYELFIRNEFVPIVKSIAAIIDEHSNIMEPVPASRLEEIFGTSSTGYGQTWHIAPRMWFYSLWISYSKSWDTTLNLWDNGCYTQIRPTVPFPCGLLFFNIEAQGKVANVEKKLIGISQMHGYGSS